MKFNKILSTVLLGGMLLSACSSPAGGSSSSMQSDSSSVVQPTGTGSLMIYTWEGMFPTSVIDGFTAETGIKVEFSSFDTDENMLATLTRTNAAEHDIVIADDYIVKSVIDQGLALKLDKTKIPNIVNMDERFTSQFYDTNNEYTMPYGAGIPMIVYDPKLTGFEIKSYNDLWDERLKDNIALIGNYRVINGITLKTMGESMNTEDITKLKAVGEKLKNLSKNVRVISDDNTQNHIISGEVAAAFLYTSQVTAALSQRSDLKAVIPSEGAGFGIMPAFIPAKAPHAEEAHKFLDYISRPEVAAKCFEHIGYYSTNKAANEHISEKLRASIVMPSDMANPGEIIRPISNEANDQMMLNWNEFKAGK